MSAKYRKRKFRSISAVLQCIRSVRVTWAADWCISKTCHQRPRKGLTSSFWILGASLIHAHPPSYTHSHPHTRTPNHLNIDAGQVPHPYTHTHPPCNIASCQAPPSYTHTHPHTRTRTLIHAHPPSYTHTHPHTRTSTLIHVPPPPSYKHTHPHTRTSTLIYARTPTHP
jgi:hypothetical protein